MSTRVLLIRHARTDADARLCGSFDVPLSEEGVAQLRALSRRRPVHSAPGALYTSPLTRARQVAAALAIAWGLEPRIAEWAREIHCGDVEGMPLDQLQREHPVLWARNQAQDDDRFAWPGGESYREFRARVLDGLAGLAEVHAGERLAVVTHAGAITQVLGAARGRSAAVWSEDRPDPLTAIDLVWRNGGPAEILEYHGQDWF